MNRVPTISVSSIVTAVREQLSADLGGESVILALGSGQYYSLNEVGSRIWQLLQEPTRVSDVRDAILQEYEVDPEECKSDLLMVLEELAAEGMIEIDEPDP